MVNHFNQNSFTLLLKMGGRQKENKTADEAIKTLLVFITSRQLKGIGQ